MKRKIRLMLITHDLAYGGLQQVVLNICKAINRDKFNVSVLCLRGLGVFVPEVEKLGIKVFLLPQKNGTDYFSFLKVAKILKQEKTDIIHTHNTQPFVDGTLGALISGVKTVVHTDHARSFPDKRRYMFAEWLMSQFAYKIVGVSDDTVQKLIKYERISRKKALTIPNGVDETRFSVNIDGRAKRRELGISGNGPVIGLGVRLVEGKGINYLLSAMPDVINSFPDLTLVIAGDGPGRDKLERQSVELRINQNVLFLGPRLDVPELLKTFDLYVLPSLSEGLPMALLEAMASGCPIVTTNVGGISTLIRHGVNGSLTDPKNPKGLAVAIVELLSDRELRHRYAKNGMCAVHKEFSADLMTRKYEQLYLRNG